MFDPSFEGSKTPHPLYGKFKYPVYYAICWNRWLKDTGSTNDLQLWELEVREMFPNMVQDSVFQSLKDFAELVQKARGKRGKDPFFCY